MKFSKIRNWATGNSALYLKEEEVYQEIKSQIERLEEILNRWIEEHKSELQQVEFLYEGKKWDLLSFTNYIGLIKKNIKDPMQNALLVVRYNEILEKELIEVKDKLLLKPPKKGFQEGIEILTRLNTMIKYYRNLKAFEKRREIASYRELEELKNAISLRESEILPYLDEYKEEKRKRK